MSEPSFPSQSSPDRPTRGRARARVKRRQQERLTRTGSFPVVPPLSGESAPIPRRRPVRGASSHIRVPGSNRIHLPRINLSIDRVVLYIIGSVVIVVLVVFILGRVRNRPAEGYPNAVWISDEWTYSTPEDEQLASFVDKLRENQVGVVYAWVSQLEPTGSWFGSANFDNVSAFAERFKEAYPDSNLYGWINVPGSASAGYSLDQPPVQTIVADLSQRIVGEFGFDGVFLNVDPVTNGDPGYLALLRRVRGAIGLDTPMGAAVPPDWTPVDAEIPLPPQIAPGTVWDDTYKQSVALLVDHMTVRTYNTGFASAVDYSEWVAYQVEAFTEAVAELGVTTTLYFGLPTYDASPPLHDPAAENVESAAAGIRRGLNALEENADFVGGVAVYAEWTTDDDEWEAFRRAWLGN
jgi:hypothetical protein